MLALSSTCISVLVGACVPGLLLLAGVWRRSISGGSLHQKRLLVILVRILRLLDSVGGRRSPRLFL